MSALQNKLPLKDFKKIWQVRRETERERERERERLCAPNNILSRVLVTSTFRVRMVTVC